MTFTPDDAATYTTQTASVTITVTPATLTITANDAAMTYGGTVPTFTASYRGFVNGDTMSVLTGAPSLTNTATSTSPVGTYTITAGQGTLSAVNYTFALVNGTLTIGKAVLTVTAQNAAITYGGTLPTFTVNYSGFVNGDTASVLTGSPSLTTGATSASPAGTYAITAAQGTLSAASYAFAFVNGTLAIGKAALTVTAQNAGMIYGGTVPTFTANYSGFVNGDTPSILTGAPSLTTAATSLSPVGAYTITAAQGTLSTANYAFVLVNSTLTISQAPATVTLGNLVQTYSGAPEPVSVTTSPPGLAVAVTYTGSNATVYGPTASAPTNPGTYSVVAIMTDPNFTGGANVTLEIDQLSPALSLALLAGMPEPSPYGTRVYYEHQHGDGALSYRAGAVLRGWDGVRCGHCAERRELHAAGGVQRSHAAAGFALRVRGVQRGYVLHGPDLGDRDAPGGCGRNLRYAGHFGGQCECRADGYLYGDGYSRRSERYAAVWERGVL